MERLNLAKRWMFSISSLHGPPQSDAPYSQLWSLFAFARLDWRTGHVRDDVALRYRPRSPHQNRNRQPNQDNEYERPKSIGENGVHALTMRLPEFDCYGFSKIRRRGSVPGRGRPTHHSERHTRPRRSPRRTGDGHPTWRIGRGFNFFRITIYEGRSQSNWTAQTIARGNRNEYPHGRGNDIDNSIEG